MSASAEPPHRCPGCQSTSLQPRNLAVFIDGTSNKPGPRATNVMKLYGVTLGDLGGHAVEQHTRYFEGIGARDTDDLPFLSYLPKVIYAGCEMAFAWNAEKNVKEAYKWLRDKYQKGDEIYLFGFSRGAYQVRALAGMIHEVGLLKEGEDRIDEAYRYYCSIKPNNPQTKEKASMFKKNFCRLGVRIHFMGVWDTVSSLGLISQDVYITASATLNPCHFRHALALDERRVKFMTEYYTEVNAHRRNVASPRYVASDSDVKEVWFAGCHSDIGGMTRPVPKEPGANSSQDDYHPVHAGNVPLLWMKREASEKGFVFDSDRFPWWPEDVDLGRGDSMNPFWRILEVVPVRHQVSFSGTGKRERRKHGFHPRLVIPGQEIHPSVFLEGVYTPYGTLAHRVKIPMVVKRARDERWSIEPCTTEPMDEEMTTSLLTSLLSDEEKTLQCLGEVSLLLSLRLDNSHSGAIRVPEWLNKSMVELSGLDKIALTIIHDGISNSPVPEALANEARTALRTTLASPNCPNFPRALYILRFSARHEALRRRFIAYDEVIDALMLALGQISKSSSKAAFPLIVDSLRYLIDDKESRTKVVSRLTKPLAENRARPTRLSSALEVKEPSHLTASLKMVASLAQHEAVHCNELRPKIINLAKQAGSPVGSAAVEVLVTLEKSGSISRSVHFSNILNYLADTLPRLDAEISYASSRGEIDIPLVLQVDDTRGLDEKTMRKFVSTIRSWNTRQRTAATLTLLKLCDNSSIRKFCSQMKVLDTFMEQTNEKKTSLLAAYALATCLRHEDMWKTEHFPRVAQHVVNMVDKGWFDDAVGLVEGAAIFHQFLESDKLKAIIDRSILVATLQKKLEVGDHHEARMSLKCLEIIWKENPADLKRTVTDSLKLLKDKNVKNRKRGIKTLASLAQTEAGEKAIKPHVNTIVEMLLPLGKSCVPRHELFSSAAALYDLCKNATLREQIRETEGYKSFKAQRRNSTLYPQTWPTN